MAQAVDATTDTTLSVVKENSGIKVTIGFNIPHNPLPQKSTNWPKVHRVI